MKVFVVPLQSTLPLLKDGVTIIVATIGVVPLLIALKEGISPFPDAGNPIEAVLLVHE
ncbi:hypothetical protein D3C72_2263820 [compost metagenome]